MASPDTSWKEFQEQQLAQLERLRALAARPLRRTVVEAAKPEVASPPPPLDNYEKERRERDLARLERLRALVAQPLRRVVPVAKPPAPLEVEERISLPPVVPTGRRPGDSGLIERVRTRLRTLAHQSDDDGARMILAQRQPTDDTLFRPKDLECMNAVPKDSIPTQLWNAALATWKVLQGYLLNPLFWGATAATLAFVLHYFERMVREWKLLTGSYALVPVDQASTVSSISNALAPAVIAHTGYEIGKALMNSPQLPAITGEVARIGRDLVKSYPITGALISVIVVVATEVVRSSVTVQDKYGLPSWIDMTYFTVQTNNMANSVRSAVTAVREPLEITAIEGLTRFPELTRQQLLTTHRDLLKGLTADAIPENFTPAQIYMLWEAQTLARWRWQMAELQLNTERLQVAFFSNAPRSSALTSYETNVDKKHKDYLHLAAPPLVATDWMSRVWDGILGPSTTTSWLDYLYLPYQSSSCELAAYPELWPVATADELAMLPRDILQQKFTQEQTLMQKAYYSADRSLDETRAENIRALEEFRSFSVPGETRTHTRLPVQREIWKRALRIHDRLMIVDTESCDRAEIPGPDVQLQITEGNDEN